MSENNVYRDGRVHVHSELCSTCIYRPGNLMFLRSGTVRDMADAAVDDGAAIICHQTLYPGPQAVCRGFFDRHPTPPLILAVQLDMIEFVDPGEGEDDGP